MTTAFRYKVAEVVREAPETYDLVEQYCRSTISAEEFMARLNTLISMIEDKVTDDLYDARNRSKKGLGSKYE